jgi:hypothetical protein
MWKHWRVVSKPAAKTAPREGRLCNHQVFCWVSSGGNQLGRIKRRGWSRIIRVRLLHWLYQGRLLACRRQRQGIAAILLSVRPVPCDPGPVDIVLAGKRIQFLPEVLI